MCLHNIGIHRIFYHNQYIDECARNNLSEILKSHSFLVRCRWTYVVNLIPAWTNEPAILPPELELLAPLLLEKVSSVDAAT